MEPRPHVALVLALVTILAGCSYIAPMKTASTELALAFANALAKGDAARAHGMLSAKLRSATTPDKLAAEYKEMISYGSGPPTTVAVMTTMPWWPDKQAGDTAWVYVAMANDTYSEAVTVVVAQEPSGLVIRSIEWGRP